MGQVTYSLLFTFNLTVHHNLTPLLYLMTSHSLCLYLTNMRMVIPSFYHNLWNFYLSWISVLAPPGAHEEAGQDSPLTTHIFSVCTH